MIALTWPDACVSVAFIVVGMPLISTLGILIWERWVEERNSRDGR